MSSWLHRAQIYGLSPAWLFMCHSLLFQEMNHLPHRAHWYEFSTGWSFMCFFMQWLNVNPMSHRAQWYVILLASLFKWYHTDHSVMDSPQYESLCVSLCGSWRWIPRHTEYRDMNCLQHDTSCVSVYRSRRWNFYHTEGTDRMTLNMFLHVVAEFETTVTQSTMLCNLPGMAIHVYC